ncbi:hypothetical protein H101_04360 [Trichophyton interdigitale H6]|nr:hypothetical protein H101_04360 [Trichophyton interdigitale H6]
MVLSRSPALRSLWAQSRRISAPRVPATRAWQRVSRRGYADQAHGSHEAGSDMPWLLGSVAFTLPAAYYLYQSGPAGKSGHDAHPHVEHAVEKVKEVVSEPVKEEAKPEPAAEPKADPEETKAEEPKAEEPKTEEAPKAESETEEKPKEEEKPAEAPAEKAEEEKPKVSAR